ncbi:class I SAM-dependent methyltransferase [Filimonas effusa]|uniref:Class I SAM-dependent methyltransferase n=1 Tax=Filimonas effusa TaxID=2508721 RepID=A0A4Q1D9J7_9BACT|nr:class I SAM-dependent methyltransferase [Filimonas effusa]RXK85900.1 class I SAM-dependent methyltransferase [Filimonas effusa]
MNSPLCPICNICLDLKYELKYNVYVCRECKLLHADAKFEYSFESDLESGARDIGLKQLRLKNFATIIDVLKKNAGERDENLSGLEIGSGNGWWLHVCKQNGLDCIGIEPERIYESYHKEKNLNVVYGFYPDVSPAKKEGYDFIIFNDVFEHIPDINALLISLRKDLKQDGVLILNLPMSNGFFFRMATFLHNIGVSKPLTRMWQFNFHSPHMNYFNPDNLRLLLNSYGFTAEESLRLDTLDMEHTKERIMADRAVSRLKAWCMASLLRFLKPIIDRSESDIRVFFFKQKAK